MQDHYLHWGGRYFSKPDSDSRCQMALMGLPIVPCNAKAKALVVLLGLGGYQEATVKLCKRHFNGLMLHFNDCVDVIHVPTR